MATWNPDNVILTQIGNEALSKVQVGEGKLTVSRVVTGSGYVSYAQLYKQTQVTGIKQEMTVVGKNTDEQGSEIKLTLSNEHLTEEYDLYQIGVYCTHPDFPDEFLYVIAQCDITNPDHIPLPSLTVANMSFSLYVEHSNTTNFEIVVDPKGPLLVDMLGDTIAELDENQKLKEAQIPDSVARLGTDNKLKEDQIPNSVATLGQDNKLKEELIPSSVARLDTNNKLKEDQIPSTVATLGTDKKIKAENIPDNVALLGDDGKLSKDKLPSSVALLGTDNKLPAENIPDSVATDDEVSKAIAGKAEYKYVASNTNLTTLLSSTGITPFWSVFTSPQGATANNSIYFIYPILNNSGAKTGRVYIEQTDLIEFKKYCYTGADTAISSSLWEPIGGGNSGTGVYYGRCNTSSGTGAKTVTIPELEELVAGTVLVIFFDNVNTASSVTLNVNSLGAKSIYDKMATGFNSQAYEHYLLRGLCTLVYNGAAFWLQENVADGSYFGSVRLSDSISSGNRVGYGYAATPYAVKQAYDYADDAYGYADDAYTYADGKSEKAMYNATLNTSSWTSNSNGGYMLTLTVTGIVSTDTPVIGIVQTGTMSTDKALIEAWALVSRITTGTDSITAYAYGNKPTVNIPIQIMCMR